VVLVQKRVVQDHKRVVEEQRLVVEPPQEAKEPVEEEPIPALHNPGGAAEHGRIPSGSSDAHQSGPHDGDQSG